MAEVCVSLLTRVLKSTHTHTHPPHCEHHVNLNCVQEAVTESHVVCWCYIYFVENLALTLSFTHSLSSLYVLISTLFHSHAYASAWTAFYEYALKYHTHTLSVTRRSTHFARRGKRSHNFLPGDWLRKLVIFTMYAIVSCFAKQWKKFVTPLQ